jgi:hypothetical protein
VARACAVQDLRLEYLEEAFTSSHWILRIYRVVHPHNRAPGPALTQA